MDSFAAGKIDADLMTNGDTLVTGAGSGKGIMSLPAALPLFVSGLAGLGWLARRKKRKVAACSTA